MCLLFLEVRKELESLDLDLPTIMNHHVGAMSVKSGSSARAESVLPTEPSP